MDENLFENDPVDLRVHYDETLREKTVKVLREAILNGHFKPGQRLVERELCEKAQVSRTSVREALRHLEAEGLIEVRGTKGVYVASLTHNTAMEIYEVRAALESEAAFHFATRASSQQIARLEGIFRELERAATSDNELYRRASDRFFEVLLEGAGNRTAEELMRLLRARISYLRARTTRLTTPERLETSVKQLDVLTQAVRARDGAAAAAACREIVERSARFAAEIFDSGNSKSNTLAD